MLSMRMNRIKSTLLPSPQNTYLYMMGNEYKDIHYKGIGVILNELHKRPKVFIDIRKIIKSNNMLFPDNSVNRFDYMCEVIGRLVSSKGLTTNDESNPNYKYHFLKITDEGTKILDTYKTYYAYYKHQERGVWQDIMKKKYWYLVFVGGFVIGFMLEKLLQCLT